MAVSLKLKLKRADSQLKSISLIFFLAGTHPQLHKTHHIQNYKTLKILALTIGKRESRK